MSDPIPNIDPQAAVPPEGSPPPVDWSARYNGLNRVYQEKQAEWQTKVSDIEAKATAAASQATELTGRLSSLDQQLKERESKLTEFQTAAQTAANEAATLKAVLERKDLLITEYPDLLQHEAKGLIRPDLHGDELRKHLEDHRATLQSTHSNALQNQIRGFVPAPPNASPAGGGAQDAETVFANMKVAMDKRDWKTYESLTDQYAKLTSTKK